ncbi:MAG TPA: AAC(3) family N-acetyltransferase [Mycobacteriales bacterium]|nr:AAC(3) family N-acetyltransferase [Mycobacteriales bacterium]
MTTAALVDDLRRLGVRPGETLLVHSSLRALGWVAGAAPAVVRSLLDVLGPAGTVVVPSQTADNRDPSTWDDPPPESWWAEIRNHVAGFDPVCTPSRRMGAIAECVRTWPGAVRSAHPQTSFAAVGPAAGWLLHPHELAAQLGEASPLGRLAGTDARILLLGVGYDRCTAFHLAEHRLPAPPSRPDACALLTPQGRIWRGFTAVHLDATDFAALGHDLEAETDLVRHGRVGAAAARLLPLAHAVDYAEKWLLAHR